MTSKEATIGGFVPGDVVELRLAPGGSTMTIESITTSQGGHETAECVWHNQAGGPFRQTFNVNRLRLVRRGDVPTPAPAPAAAPARVASTPDPFFSSYVPDPTPDPEPVHHHHQVSHGDHAPPPDYSSPSADPSPSYDGGGYDGGGGGDFGGGGSSGDY